MDAIEFMITSSQSGWQKCFEEINTYIRMKQNFEKLDYISVLRVSSMMLIILFHSLCFYSGTWWYLNTNVIPLWKLLSAPTVKVGLTTFFFISGYLYGYMYLEKGKYRDVKSFLSNKFRRLLIPYLFWGIQMILTMKVLHIAWINLFTGVAHLWFLLVLFELFLIMVILTRIGIGSCSTIIVDLIIIVSSFITLYIWQNTSTHHHVLCIEEMMYYLPSFVMGFYCVRYSKIEINKYLLIVLFVISLFLMFLLSYYNYPESHTLYRIPAIMVSCSSLMLMKNQSNTICESFIFKNLDKNSMGIYIFNQIVVFLLLFIPETNNYLSYHTYVGVLIIFTISLIIPWLLANIFNKVKMLSYLIG